MILTREKLEEMEAERLAAYAVKSRESRGRVYPDEEHAYRSAFQRDRDRVIHTTAFRRLEYKTQVFVNYEGDYYRTRLTHTLEVAQIGRTLARALMVNEDLVEAICLAHDLGHTPFGHAGEATLHELMENHGGFDHNHQSLRIVDKLENRHREFPGLNLTWETREGIIKHKTDYDKGEATGFEPDKRASLEGQIVNLADEIAYTTHDLDDGLRAGLLQPVALDGIAIWDETMRRIEASSRQFSELTRHRLIRRLISMLVTDVIYATERRLVETGVQSADDVRALPDNLVDFSPDMAAKTRELKDFLYKNMYCHYRMVRMATKARRLLTQLFETYVNEPSQLPDSTCAKLEDEPLYRVVCDYIAGMTDRYALEEHKKLFDPGKRA